MAASCPLWGLANARPVAVLSAHGTSASAVGEAYWMLLSRTADVSLLSEGYQVESVGEDERAHPAEVLFYYNTGQSGAASSPVTQPALSKRHPRNGSG